jgi:hypothetical protein
MAAMPGDHRVMAILADTIDAMGPVDTIGVVGPADTIGVTGPAETIGATGPVDTIGAVRVIAMMGVGAIMWERVRVVTPGRLTTTGAVASASCRIVNRR